MSLLIAIALVVQKVDSAIHSVINLYQVEDAIGFSTTYLLDIEKSGG